MNRIGSSFCLKLLKKINECLQKFAILYNSIMVNAALIYNGNFAFYCQHNPVVLVLGRLVTDKTIDKTAEAQ